MDHYTNFVSWNFGLTEMIYLQIKKEDSEENQDTRDDTEMRNALLTPSPDQQAIDRIDIVENDADLLGIG